jgi:hypothetical protein
MNLDNFSTEELAAELKRRKLVPHPIRGNFKSPVGLWDVSTEGDCEGKSVTDLGTHRGHIVDIALLLSPFSFYELKFEPARQTSAKKQTLPPRETVGIALGISSGTWDLKGADRVRSLESFLNSQPSKTPFKLTGDTSYAGATLSFK